MAAIRLSQLASMSPREQEQQLESLVSASQESSSFQVKEKLSCLNLRIKELESRYEMSSMRMKQSLSSGRIKETADICSWLLLLKQRESLGKKPTQSRTKSVTELLRDS